MNLFDLCIILLAVLMGVSGWHEGLVRGGVKLIGFLLILVALSVCAGQITEFARGIEGIPSRLAIPIVFIGIFIAGSILFAVLAEALRKVVHLTPLGLADSGLGMLFGAVKAFFIAGIVALVFSFMPAHGALKTQYEHSRFGNCLAELVKKTIPAATSAGIGILKYFTPPAKPGSPEKQLIPENPSTPEQQKKRNGSSNYTI
jgi:uncharacterized membrane protein required for colicin V production